MPDNSMQLVELSLIKTDDDQARRTQLRLELNDERVEDYAEDMAAHAAFPAIDLVEDADGRYIVADGWHRTHAAQRLGRQRIAAIVHAVPDGVEPLQHAMAMALKANTNHGLHMTRGDKAKKAREAILHPDFADLSYREMAKVTGVSKSTLQRIHNRLVAEGVIEHPDFDARLPPWGPLDHASSRVLNETFSDFSEREEVYDYVGQLNAPSPRAWEWDSDLRVLTHTGLELGETLHFSIDDNPIVNGMPTNFEKANRDEANLPDNGIAFNQLPQEERDRLEAARARREYYAADSRLRIRGDDELTQVLDILRRRVDEPHIWEDLRTLFQNAGPSEDHEHTDF